MLPFSRGHLERAVRDLVAHGRHRLHVLGDRAHVGVRHVAIPAERHRRAHERAVGSARVADRIDDLVLRPRADAGLHVGRDVAGVRLEHRLLDDEGAGEVLACRRACRRVGAACGSCRSPRSFRRDSGRARAGRRCRGSVRRRPRPVQAEALRRVAAAPAAARALLRGRNPRLPESSLMSPRSRGSGAFPLGRSSPVLLP